MFDAKKRLSAIFASQLAAAHALNVLVQSVHYACSGRTITCQGLYFRVNNDAVLVDAGDLGVLNLDDYDAACGVERRTYETSNYKTVGKKQTSQRQKATRAADNRRLKHHKDWKITVPRKTRRARELHKSAFSILIKDI